MRWISLGMWVRRVSNPACSPARLMDSRCVAGRIEYFRISLFALSKLPIACIEVGGADVGSHQVFDKLADFAASDNPMKALVDVLVDGDCQFLLHRYLFITYRGLPTWHWLAVPFFKIISGGKLPWRHVDPNL